MQYRDVTSLAIKEITLPAYNLGINDCANYSQIVLKNPIDFDVQNNTLLPTERPTLIELEYKSDNALGSGLVID